MWIHLYTVHCSSSNITGWTVFHSLNKSKFYSGRNFRSRLKPGNACYHSVQNLLSSNLRLKNLKIWIYRTIILPVVLYRCETWSLTLREERKLRVFENKMLRRIFGPKKDDIIREWRKLHNMELNGLYSSPNFFRVIKSRRMR